jgi:hypothetical protein
MLKIAPSLFLLLSVTCAGGCATTVKSRDYPALLERGVPIARIAIAPFEATGRLAQMPDSAPGAPRSVATALVARYVSEALAARGIDVVPADDVARALAVESAAHQRLVPRAVAQVVAREFGADAVLLGGVSRFVERSGHATGTLHPAGVGFEVTLYAAPGAQKLWSAVFDETQKALSENVLSTYRYPGGGMRWLTAEELARWGAKETAEELPVE